MSGLFKKMLITNRQLDDIIEVAREKTGTNLQGYRRQTIFKHVSERLESMRMSVDEYTKLCHWDEHECRELIKKVSIKVSHFFRNPVVFEILAQSVVPSLLENVKDELRVWSAGCAAGQEPYSLAILINEAISRNNHSDIMALIFATDLDTKILAEAQKGVYNRNNLQDTKLRIVDEYFTVKNELFVISDDIKNMVHFSVDNIMSNLHASPAESIYGGFHLILCRNVIIYFAPEIQNAIQKKLTAALNKGGFLILGSSETLSEELRSSFKVIDFRNRIYQKI